MRKPKKKQTGFTLLELVLTTVLMGIIAVVLGQILFQGYQTFMTANNISEVDWQGLLAVERFAEDLKTIRSANDITSATATAFSFIGSNNASVQYQLSGTSLLRNSQPLANNVQSMNLTYLDKNGATTATSTAIRYISYNLSFTQSNLTTSFASLTATRGMQ